MRKPLPFGKYLLLDRIAVGGMAEVFVAKTFGVAGFERILAIKRILPTMVEDPEFIAMFVDEARIAVQLAHANIVQIHELGKHEESLYIAMEYVSGRDLRAILDRLKKKGAGLPVPLACLIGTKICEALDYAHRKRGPDLRPLGIIHRDVSPQNVLISFEGEVKICDFGIAKAADRSQKTQSGILKGKFGYMSPEQVRGLPIDRRSDIFAAGALLFEMLTGEKLFHGESDFSTLEKVRKAEVPPLGALNAAVTEPLERIVRKALAKEPEDRYPWASDLHDDLLRFLVQGELVFASKHLGQFMREGFADDLSKEEERAQRWAQVPMPKAPPPAPLALHTPPGGAALRVEPARTDEFAPFAEERRVPAPATIPESVLREASRAEGAVAAGIQAPAEMNRELPPDPSFMNTEQFRVIEDSDTLATPAPMRSPLLGPAVTGDEPPGDQTTPETPIPGKGPMSTQLLGGSPAGPGPDEEEPTGPMREPAEAPPKVRRAAVETPLPARRAVVELDEEEEELAPRGGVRVGRWIAFAFAALASAGLVVATGWFVFSRFDEPETAILVISAQPSSAELTLDGHPAMLPFIDRRIPKGKHTVILRAPGYREYAEEIFLEGGKTRTLPIELPPLEEAVRPPPPEEEEEEETAPAGGEGEEEAVEEGGKDDARKAARASTRAAADSRRAAPERAEVPPSAPERTPAPAPAPAPEAERSAAGGAGLLVFSMPPGAAITVDGKAVGTTPLTLADLPAKTYRVAVHLPGYEREETEVRLKAGQTVPVRLRLRPIGSGGGGRAGEDMPVPPPSLPAAAAAAPGKLICSSRPVAKVYVDGRDTGRWTPVTPAQPLDLAAGKRRITFVTEDGRRHDLELTVRPGETARLVGINIP